MRDDSRPPRPIALAAVQLFIGVGALYGGGGLVADPSGAMLGMPLALLDGSPFDDFLVPGLTLLVVNGMGSLLGAALTLARVRWAGALAMALGAFLAAWIGLQVLWIGPLAWLQPLMLGSGLVEAALGWTLLRTPTARASG